MGAVTSIFQPSQERLTRPAAADLFRVLATGMVGWFHIWQQSWVGAGKFDRWPRTGALWVDVLVLLSAFCLFLPYANAAAKGLPVEPPRPLEFWRKRAVRIIPAYYASLLFSLVLAVQKNGFDRALGEDLLMHLTFTQMFAKETYLHTKLNGVSWTLTVFAVFYLLFPWLCRSMLHIPVQTVTGLLAVQAGYTLWVLPQFGTNEYPFLFNQMPAFAGVLAVGMVGAWTLAKAGRNAALQTPCARIAWTVLGSGFLWLMDCVLKIQVRANNQHTQLLVRMPLVLAAGAALVCFSLGVRLPLAGVWKRLAGISYSFYLWHQMLAVWIKYTLHLPAWTGETPPNQLGDAVWMHRYNALAWGAALVVAVVGTYLIERPAVRWLNRRKLR